MTTGIASIQTRVSVCIVQPASCEPLHRILWPLLAGDVFGDARPAVHLSLLDPVDLAACQDVSDSLLDGCLASPPGSRVLATDSCLAAVADANYCLMGPAGLGQRWLGQLCQLLQQANGGCRAVVLLAEEADAAEGRQTVELLRRRGVPVSGVSYSRLRPLAACQRLCHLLGSLHLRGDDASDADAIESPCSRNECDDAAESFEALQLVAAAPRL